MFGFPTSINIAMRILLGDGNQNLSSITLSLCLEMDEWGQGKVTNLKIYYITNSHTVLESCSTPNLIFPILISLAALSVALLTSKTSFPRLKLSEISQESWSHDDKNAKLILYSKEFLISFGEASRLIFTWTLDIHTYRELYSWCTWFPMLKKICYISMLFDGRGKDLGGLQENWRGIYMITRSAQHLQNRWNTHRLHIFSLTVSQGVLFEMSSFRFYPESEAIETKYALPRS